jgi:acetyl esterase
MKVVGEHMELDADTAAMLEVVNRGPKVGTQTIADMRATSVATPKPPQDPLVRVEDAMIPGLAGDVPVRIYADSVGSPLGVTVFFHGGGWVLSSVDGHDSMARRLAKLSGHMVVSVEYRLAPEHQFPSAHDDCWSVVSWIAANGASIGADPERIAVGGDSAGGNLAASMALRARDEGVALRHQLLIYPCLDVDFTRQSYRENAKGYFLETEGMKWFWGQYVRVEDRTNPYAVPMASTDLHRLCSATVQTVARDPLRDEGEAYAHRLRAAGVTVHLTRYNGVVHGFMNRWHLMARAEVALVEAANELRRALD